MSPCCAKQGMSEFLDGIDYGVMFHEFPADLACAYLEGHLVGRAGDWYGVVGSSCVAGVAADFAQLERALKDSSPVVRGGG
ncbi:hypothetical protein NPIL_229641 [Nephila pilipes]|uniref:Uncharacterized protein n=1 Tax=Nephila pilipes TaxID=299642 RepID=A0A8X6QT40_NEPPI|nr:hypothetical protein NPIL_229641 [Nephila pilipes]